MPFCETSASKQASKRELEQPAQSLALGKYYAHGMPL
jgi:hypothetical protein